MSSGRTLATHTIPVAGSQHGTNDTKSQTPLRIPNDLGNITKLITIPYHPSRIFASHDDGKISVWDTKTQERIQVITVSMYGICTMASVGEYHVWAGYNTGMIYVYDTRPENWAVLKMWKAHTGAVTQLAVDESSLILDEIKGRLQVVSSDSNGFVGIWDGLLTEHWKDAQLQKRSSEFCEYEEARVMICSWNIDANKPEKIIGEDDKAVREWLGTMEDPDIIVVGIQEIVDLESKKQTARSLFTRKKIDLNETEDALSHRYKLWHDYLIRIISENYGYHNYTVLKTDQMVGLFSCIFVRTNDLNRVFDVESTSVKTGLKVMNKSIHGNKGGIAIRFVFDHSSLCFVNCHLAAGQNHVQQRNADAEGILQSASFPRRDYADVFVHGGDGAMILDHEFCFLSGDLNYRIKMARKDVLRILANNNKLEAWQKLQEQDQLLRQKLNNPLFKLLTFEEAPIRFDPTYKYDPGTDFYDSSEKKRVPAWCDRVLYKGKNIQNLFYRRYEPRCSDHRPIAAGFSFETKITDQKKRDMLMSKVEEEWREYVDRFIKDKKARYVADYEMCSLSEAFTRLEKSDWDVNDTVIKLLGGI
ncbi:Endonuclease/exonuclease/phosphatase [Blakeslea trispora]|nr:Endonuclease/exonuclease/phosphatase [Blakeslea trispora]